MWSVMASCTIMCGVDPSTHAEKKKRKRKQRRRRKERWQPHFQHTRGLLYIRENHVFDVNKKPHKNLYRVVLEQSVKSAAPWSGTLQNKIRMWNWYTPTSRWSTGRWHLKIKKTLNSNWKIKKKIQKKHCAKKSKAMQIVRRILVHVLVVIFLLSTNLDLRNGVEDAQIKLPSVWKSILTKSGALTDALSLEIVPVLLGW